MELVGVGSCFCIKTNDMQAGALAQSLSSFIFTASLFRSIAMAACMAAAAAAEEAANTSFFYNTPFPACTLLIQNETHTHTHTHTHIVQGYSIGSRRSSSSSRSC